MKPGTAVLHIRYKSPATYTRKLYVNNVAQNVTYPATGSAYTNLDIIVSVTASTTFKFDLSYLYLDYYQLVALP